MNTEGVYKDELCTICGTCAGICVGAIEMIIYNSKWRCLS